MNREYILKIIKAENTDNSIYTPLGYFQCRYEWNPTEPKARFKRDMELLGWQAIYNFVEKEKKFPRQAKVRFKRGGLEVRVE